MTTYEIPARNIDRLATTVAALNKRAARLGVSPLAFARTGGEWCHVEYLRSPDSGKFLPTHRYEVVEVELDGGRIGLAGWHLVGTIEHLDPENVLRAVPGETVPESYRTGAQACDHCGLDRRRADTFVVAHEDGSVKQLGRTCIADYLGHTDPARLASWLEAVSDLTRGGEDGDEDADDRGPRARESYRPDEVVAIARGAIRAFGWVSRKAAGQGAHSAATADIVGTYLHPRGYRDLTARGMTVDAEDYERAEADLAWAAEQSAASDYIANLRALARQERVDARAMGLLASLPAAHDRAIETAAEKAAREASRAKAREAADPAPTGKVTIEGVVVGRREVDSQYGVQHKMTVLAPGGWRVYATVPAAITEVEVGDTVRFDATLEASQDDPTFAFAKRPTKAVITQRATPADCEDCGHAAHAGVCGVSRYPEADGFTDYRVIEGGGGTCGCRSTIGEAERLRAEAVCA